MELAHNHRYLNRWLFHDNAPTALGDVIWATELAVFFVSRLFLVLCYLLA